MGFFEKFKQGLKKTRESFFGKMKSILSGKKLDDETKEEIEELLILSDVGFEATEYILNRIEELKGEDAYESLKKVLLEILNFNSELKIEKKPFVISMVGVNGSGKTTTAGKLAEYFSKSGKSVVLAACDTFRAAAIDQLKVWAERTSSTFIAHQEGADSAAVAFDAVSHAISKEKDIVILDTAGRLHTKKNLMEELRKINRVIKKKIEDAPHEVLLVIDAVTGQNGLQQAKIFKEFVDITGIVLTKLDGTAKGGIAIAIAKELGIPIKFVGLGEGVDDLKPFDAEDFVNALLEG
ncbi:signal recognition particle-docking protein FtsY [Thermosipho africanus H17ap60334]|jgi:fused signal recognition particle receptor|uniref:Signal recognition particle receptor FtsY n=1 Tax=Thermosipho africanus (strain TCF52B) TaxID=484019 RepID=B7IE87_THEAB|nr:MULTISPECIES: signal recognition particle-docking protein FtsY [Thermosipho]ACJ76314.1 signal recognition particle-docking protein FtsY [Thermosipho africanus TCF52B]EKF49193.1 signal recognition particle-docking protein FtsY [Thermosipho africanus H17ap60334]MBZ4650340.1 ftsY [Thermosipho sp. (in: thermotogales)]MDK2840264.1 fused signal recognition particle receptor [Thermosipho sp. (in: thermotogales)]MDK2900366.1 fused signal recognition particle receptor [Thermosipho sp. (in: thermotog